MGAMVRLSTPSDVTAGARGRPRRTRKPESTIGCGGHMPEVLQTDFSAMGQYSMARCTGRADTTMHSAPAAKVTKRQYASLAFNWIRTFFGRWNIGHPMTITGKSSVSRLLETRSLFSLTSKLRCFRWCAGSSRNAVRPSATSVHLHRNLKQLRVSAPMSSSKLN